MLHGNIKYNKLGKKLLDMSGSNICKFSVILSVLLALVLLSTPATADSINFGSSVCSDEPITLEPGERETIEWYLFTADDTSLEVDLVTEEEGDTRSSVTPNSLELLDTDTVDSELGETVQVASGDSYYTAAVVEIAVSLPDNVEGETHKVTALAEASLSNTGNDDTHAKVYDSRECVINIEATDYDDPETDDDDDSGGFADTVTDTTSSIADTVTGAFSDDEEEEEDGDYESTVDDEADEADETDLDDETTETNLDNETTESPTGYFSIDDVESNLTGLILLAVLVVVIIGVRKLT